jgi:hypothetical protein
MLVPCLVIGGVWALHTRCIVVVFAYHVIAISLTFCLKWNVLYPRSPVLADVFFNLGVGPRG